jgi:hypothetical protein
MNFSDTENLTQLVGQRHQRLMQLYRLGQRQLECIADADLGLLLKLLAVKQQLFDELHVVERQLDPYRTQEPGDRQWQSEEARCECSQKISECELLVKEIMQQELRSQEQMVAHRDEAAELLQLGMAAGSVHQAYLGGNEPMVSQLDLSVET